ncbi:MAG: hypothetical protein CME71_03030 [Halobacteriovorax sp.]|nr:hypothetical protein [Halobacteriovorax sp.]
MMQAVLDFWFSQLSPSDWYKKDEALDQKISDLFLETYLQATKGELYQWRESIEGRLAEIIVLDQFSRNIFRDDAMAFRYDSLALVLAQEASSKPEAKALASTRKAFLYMPYMHSESLSVHDEAVRLFSEPGLENNLKFELKHKEIIERFGRYPHRNKILGRTSTQDEIEFLKQPGSSF